MALSDLLSGRQVGEVVDDLIELWEMCLRVLDDIKVVLPITLGAFQYNFNHHAVHSVFMQL